MCSRALGRSWRTIDVLGKGVDVCECFDCFVGLKVGYQNNEVIKAWLGMEKEEGKKKEERKWEQGCE